ncbi:MAG: LamG domain-containing protein, partial [Candidatus Aenigmarchaeota archaeon]|nr:LamG domain-containing protein [Candidatus Aenigmarchaeota archaeon]
GTDGRTIKDESGNNNHGTFVGETFNDGDLKPSCPNCPAQATGKYGNALRFDGTDDYVEVPDSPSLNQSSPSQNFTTLTFTAWIYVKGRGTHPSGEYIVAKGVNNAPGGGYSLQFDWLQNYSLFFVFTNESGTVTITSAANSVPWNRWTHLAATYNGSNASLYVNGIFADSAAGTGSINTSANPLRVGMRSDYPNVPFNGTIDEVRIYSRALSAAEVAEDMNSAYPIARPVASYSFEKIVSNQVQDTHNVVRGKYGSAISFDGIDDDVTIGGSSFNFGTNTDFTLEAWVSTRRIGNKNVIVKSSGGKYFNMQTNNDVGQTNAIQCQASDGTNTATINSNEAMQNISWVHAACVFDRDALLRTYINGVASATTSMTLIGDLNMPAGTNLYIGIGGAWFNGTIDEVRILNVARS